MRILTGFIVVLLAAAADAASDYYVWVDENGVTNYSERNPRDYDAEHVEKGHRFGERLGTEPETEAEPTRGSRPGANPDFATTTEPAQKPVDPDALIGEERAAIAAKIAQTKKENCAIGKRNLAQLEAYARIRVRGEDGNERVLTDEERQGQIQEARQIVRDNCTG